MVADDPSGFVKGWSIEHAATMLEGHGGISWTVYQPKRKKSWSSVWWFLVLALRGILDYRRCLTQA